LFGHLDQIDSSAIYEFFDLIRKLYRSGEFCLRAKLSLKSRVVCGFNELLHYWAPRPHEPRGRCEDECYDCVAPQFSTVGSSLREISSSTVYTQLIPALDWALRSGSYDHRGNFAAREHRPVFYGPGYPVDHSALENPEECGCCQEWFDSYYKRLYAEMDLRDLPNPRWVAVRLFRECRHLIAAGDFAQFGDYFAEFEAEEREQQQEQLRLEEEIRYEGVVNEFEAHRGWFLRQLFSDEAVFESLDGDEGW